MPFKKKDPMLPNNRKAVVKRLEGKKKRLKNDDRFYRDYCTSMSDMIEKCYAEMVPQVDVPYLTAYRTLLFPKILAQIIALRLICEVESNNTHEHIVQKSLISVKSVGSHFQ